MFVRTKIINGKKRKYLVENYRVPNVKNPRQKVLAYVDLWPEKDIKKLKYLIGKWKEFHAGSQRRDVSQAYRRIGAERAEELWQVINDFKRKMDDNLVPARERADGRRLDRSTGVRKPQYEHEKDPFGSFIYHLMSLNVKRARLFEVFPPLEKWEPSHLNDFLGAGKAFFTLYQEAQALAKQPNFLKWEQEQYRFLTGLTKTE